VDPSDNSYNTLNMVAEFEPVEEPYAFLASDFTKVKNHSAFQAPQVPWKSLQLDFHPIHTRLVTQEDIQRANEATAFRVVELTKQYAHKGKD
jgi:hypothetical protein